MVFAGMDDGNSPFTSIKNALKDEKRINYHNDYLQSLLSSIKYVIILNYPFVGILMLEPFCMLSINLLADFD